VKNTSLFTNKTKTTVISFCTLNTNFRRFRWLMKPRNLEQNKRLK